MQLLLFVVDTTMHVLACNGYVAHLQPTRTFDDDDDDDTTAIFGVTYWLWTTGVAADPDAILVSPHPPSVHRPSQRLSSL